MERKLDRITDALYYYDENGICHEGSNPQMRGDCSGLRGYCSGLRGDCSGLYGDCTVLRGDCTGLRGDCSVLRGDLDACGLTDADRAQGVNIADLVKA
jgi:hypothetical protein